MSGRRLHPILHDKFTAPVVTVRAVIADIADGGKISDVVRQINKLLPDPELKHLKKIRRTADGVCQVLVGRDELVQHKKSQLLSLPLQNLQTCEIPSRQPLTRAQFEECKLLWPTSFHEEKYVKKCCDGSRFTDKEMCIIDQMVDQLNRKQQESGTSVCMIVDGDNVLAVATDNTANHPLHHPAILAVDAIAARHRSQETRSSSSYVCTTMDAFVSEQCCLMCAMALLHSRIQRIFFLTTGGPRTGPCPADEPFTRMKLHVNDQLNHHFEAWEIRGPRDGC